MLFCAALGRCARVLMALNAHDAITAGCVNSVPSLFCLGPLSWEPSCVPFLYQVSESLLFAQ